MLCVDDAYWVEWELALKVGPYRADPYEQVVVDQGAYPYLHPSFSVVVSQYHVVKGNAEVVVAAYAGPDWVLMAADVVSVWHPHHLLQVTRWQLPLLQIRLLFHCVVIGTYLALTPSYC